tara:strand:- start:649 stop:978 length:330 start_codon:yes stop_codon:yes gene_type:complete
MKVILLCAPSGAAEEKGYKKFDQILIDGIGRSYSIRHRRRREITSAPEVDVLVKDVTTKRMARGKFKAFVVPPDYIPHKVDIHIEGIKEIPWYKANSGPGSNPVKIFDE